MELEVKEIIYETPTIIEVVFNKPEINFRPGNYIVFYLDVNDPKGNYRDFSIVSSPTEEDIRIACRLTGSVFKRKLSSLKPGDKVTVKGPFGNFLLDEKRDIIMIAGGIGITPFMSMIKYVVDLNLGTKITLFYSNRTPEEIPFKSKFDEIYQTNRNIKLVYTITNPLESKKPWNGNKGFIDSNMIKYNTSINNKLFYICGPPGMVEAMSALLKSMNIKEEDIKIENFTGY
jgi:glycine betaine catabolism B